MKTKLLCLGLISISLTAFAAPLGPDFHDRLGIQMWSLRETAKANTTKSLDLVKSYGLTLVETAGYGTLTPAQYATELKARGLKVVGAHVNYDLLKTNLPGEIANAKLLGASYIICPWIPHDEKGFTEAQAREAAANFDQWGQTVRAAGLKFGWHPHGFEFVPSSAGNGQTLFDLIVEQTDPSNVCLEMDVFWVMRSGFDPIALLKKYGSRWELFHVKDMRKGAETGVPTGRAPVTDKVSVGTGKIDWKQMLETCRSVGVQYYIVEDETTDPLKNIPDSLEYLRALKL